MNTIVFKELATSFKAILYDRVVSPLSGAFIVSWIIINWKIVAILVLGNTPILDRIDVIENKYLALENLFVKPLLSTLFLIIIYPWLSNFAYWLWQHSLSFKINTRIKFENSTPLTLEQSIELRKEIQRKDQEFNELLSGKNTKIDELEKTITYLNKTMNENELRHEDIVAKLRISPTKPTDTNDQQINSVEYINQMWKDEYNNRINNGSMLSNNFRNVIDKTLGIYKNNLNNEVFRYFVTADIVELDDQTGKLSLTKKGKYFANLFTIEE